MSKLLTIEEIRQEIIRFYDVIEIPKEIDYYIAFNIRSEYGTPCIFVDKKQYHYIIFERGYEIEHRITRNTDMLLYWVSKWITWTIAQEFAVRNPTANFAQARIRSMKQIELLYKINPEFSIRRKIEINEDLKENPFHDELPNSID